MNKLLQYLKTITFRNNLIIALVTGFVLLLLTFFVLRFYTRHGESIAVPNLKGMEIEEAIRALEAQGFRYQIDSVYQADSPPGLVIEQDPDMGTKVKNNRTLYLTIITKSAPEVQFPDLVDMALVEALATLNNYGLKLGDTTYIPDIARDRVLEVNYGGQDIQVGQLIPKGSKIDLILGDGRGDSEVEVPDLRGFTLDEARFTLQGASLSLGNVTYVGSVTDSSAARIIRQTPAADSTGQKKVSIGTGINLELSN
ncbi:PASTA domain-containing protein [Olivibacter sitiensis]|uniref:PASTA domain-containing protein n=1 Tax=Olivibacter sitiensis TaxID=376470 RepID=UPI0003FCF30E|nr:PASTA domain-containing protein [Olivibacter sitiensis]